MPFIPTQRPDLQARKGLHLYHFAGSNCSQRVRLALEEKGVRWTGHHVDLARFENITPEYALINPNALVPVLVHDGRTLIESNDIIQYIDETFDGPRLTPDNELDFTFLTSSLNRSGDFQGAVKLLTHEFLFKPFRTMSPRKLLKFEQDVDNPALVSFMREFSAGFSEQRIIAALRETETVFAELEKRLDDNEWLTGRAIGLADISWIVNLHRFDTMRYPLHTYPKVSNWLQKMRRRDSFESAIAKYEPSLLTFVFASYSRIRSLQGSSIAGYLKRIC